MGLIWDSDESACTQEAEQLAFWCGHNNLELNMLKTVEITVDYSRLQTTADPHHHSQQHCFFCDILQVWEPPSSKT